MDGHWQEETARKFYRYLCDYFIESLYLINMDLEECNKRYSFKNPELLRKLHQEGKNIIMATSHYGNWEWAANFRYWFPYMLYGIYKPLSNKLFDRLFIYIRQILCNDKPVFIKKDRIPVFRAFNALRGV